MPFNQQKRERLQHVDLSRKGSIDEYILETVSCINSNASYFTTSSCSGRIIIFESSEASSIPKSVKSVQNKIAKKGCKWLLVSHNKITLEAVEEALLSTTNEAVLKFEPMIMHIQSQSLEDAQRMHHTAVASGFRNSGISIGNKGKTVVAVRSTHGLEVPLSAGGVILVSKQYLNFLVDCANQKMDENFSRINRFMVEVRLLAEKPSCPCDAVKSKKKDKAKAALHIKGREKKEQVEKLLGIEDDVLDQELSLFVFDDT